MREMEIQGDEQHENKARAGANVSTSPLVQQLSAERPEITWYYLFKVWKSQDVVCHELQDRDLKV